MTNSLRAVPGDSWRHTTRTEAEPAPHDDLGTLPLLETKLYRPIWRAGSIARPTLVAKLATGAGGKLTLLSAPAGFGKTTLLAEWAAGAAAEGDAIAWVSLDPGDNDPALFWAYVIGALGRSCPRLDVRLPGRSPIERVLTALINRLSAMTSEVHLVLDDYHLIDAPEIHGGLTFLVEHLPPCMHVVIASRGDPSLPLPRLRARGELTEVRPADLRFSLGESRSFLESMSLDLSAEDVAALERRTEGWIAGLKLAALSMTGRTDVGRLIESFSGGNRFVADYLVEEVLSAQPERVRRFLLDTSVLDRLSGPLCDAVTGEPGSQRLLEGLERSNLFLVGLDDRREWFRYHHLFGDVLRATAERDDPVRLRELHRRASDWFDQYDSWAESVRHAFAAGDSARSAELLEQVPPAMDRSYAFGKWLAWVKSLPEPVIRSRPVLGMSYAWALLNAGELEAAEARLEELGQSLASHDRAGDADATSTNEVMDPDRLRTLTLELSSARMYLAQTRGDVPGTVEYARQALELVPEGDHHRRGTGAALLGLAYWANGELDEAYRTFASALARMRLSGNALAVIRGTFVLGDLRVVQGRLGEAAGIYRQGLQLAAELPDPTMAETDELYLGLSEVYRERGELEPALQTLQTLGALVGRGEHGANRQRWCTTRAALHAARGELDAAADLLEEAAEIQVRDPLPRPCPVPAMKARIRVAQGRLADALRWASEQGLSPDSELTYLREYEHLTLARVLLARHRVEGDAASVLGALTLLDGLAAAAEAGGRTGALIESLALRALALEADGKRGNALQALGRALALAEPEGYVRVFVDEGQPMRELLRLAAAGGAGGGYGLRLLQRFGTGSVKQSGDAAPADQPPSQQLLTRRELDILRHLASGLRTQEIAKHLFISPATVKRHVANIYSKLNARHRTEALVRAKALKLL